jgi:hypothetical protein
MGFASRFTIALACAALQGCQMNPIVSADLMRGGCLAQHYLQVNGFFDAPTDRLSVTLSTSDVRVYAGSDGVDYDRLLADRHGTFTSKLLGVHSVPEEWGHTFHFFYGSKREGARCLAVNAFDSNAIESFAWFPENNCAGEAPTMKLRERDLKCPK